MTKLTKAEKETIIRFDEEDKSLDIYTASDSMALKLQRKGYQLVSNGLGWRIRGVPASALTLRRIGMDVSGKPKRPAPEGLKRFRAVHVREQIETQSD